MGILLHGVVFDGKAPDLSRVAEKITEISTLAVSIEHLELEKQSPNHDLGAYLAFACSPQDRFKIHIRHSKADYESDSTDDLKGKSLQEPNATPETQTVCLESYVGQECTIWYATLIALEALGGRPFPPISKKSHQQYGRPITVSQLKKRRRMELVLSTIFLALALPVLIPLYLLHSLFFAMVLTLLFPIAFVICLIFQKRIQNTLRFYAKSSKKDLRSI
jgi:hypothetical protein